WDNGVSSPTQNDIASPTTIANSRVATSQHAAADAPVNSAPARNSNSPKISAVERKVAAINPIPGFTVEKRPLAQTQSRTTSNGDTCSDDSEKNMSATVMVYPEEEEEAAFLRSLGWEENNGEDEGLTEEEINAFYQEYLKLRPSLKLSRGMQAKLSESVANNLDGTSSELSSSGSGFEA
ncbi:hypothetical protein V6N11_017813, partial [Hibiscus sabdariffa]